MKRYEIEINQKKYTVEVNEVRGNRASVTVDGVAYNVKLGGDSTAAPAVSDAGAPPLSVTAPPVTPQAPAQVAGPSAAGGSGEVVSPISGLVIDVEVSEGQTVQAGDVLAKIEAMKMENNIPSPVGGRVSKICVSKGEEVKDAQLLFVIDT